MILQIRYAAVYLRITLWCNQPLVLFFAHSNPCSSSNVWPKILFFRTWLALACSSSRLKEHHIGTGTLGVHKRKICLECENMTRGYTQYSIKIIISRRTVHRHPIRGFIMSGTMRWASKRSFMSLLNFRLYLFDSRRKIRRRRRRL